MLLKHLGLAVIAAEAVTAGPTALPRLPDQNMTDWLRPRAATFDWGSEKLRGVNLGGWLVLEPWITPSIFNQIPGGNQGQVLDEFTLCEHYGKEEAQKTVLEPHWKTWIQEHDIQQIKSWGFNMVRIPIGFWAFEEFVPSTTPYASGADYHLDRAIEWSRNAGLQVMIDLHGAPLSQNGFDNSGHRMPSPEWGTGDSVADTLVVIQHIANKYAQSKYDDVIMGIELLNEPLSPDLGAAIIRNFYSSGYGDVRKVSSARTVILQDAFIPPSQWNGFLTPSDGAQRVAMDHHEYQVFSDGEVAWTPAQHVSEVCELAEPNYGGSDKWTFVGEWSGAMTDCAVYLNGYGRGARYDGTYESSTKYGSCAGKNEIENWSSTMVDNTRQYIEAQMEAFDAITEGWVFWTLKTEGSGEWDLYRLIAKGAFPQPLSARRFPNACPGL